MRRIIEGFMTVQAARQPLSHVAKITLLDSVLEDIASLEQNLPEAIRRKAYNDERVLYPTGVSECTLRQVFILGSFQISVLGLSAIVHQLQLDCIRAQSVAALESVLTTALDTTKSAVRLVTGLSPLDRSLFWMPCTWNTGFDSHQIHSTTRQTSVHCFCESSFCLVRPTLP